MKHLALAATIFLALSAQASAICPPAKDDFVTIPLSAETWASTKTPRVVMAFDAADRGTSADMRAAILTALKKLDADADWKIVRFDKTTDSAGLERVSAAAESRLPEPRVHGLAGQAKQLSRPGLQARVEAIEFSPTRAELESAQQEARSKVYSMITAESERLNKEFAGQRWRVGAVSFQGAGFPRPHADKRAAVAMMAMEAAGAEPMTTSDLVAATASVTFASTPNRACTQ